MNDRGAAKYRKAGVSLGVFSLALGAAELLGAEQITQKLGIEGRDWLVRGFGAREVAAGVTILARPAASGGAWNRVGGDVTDLTALALALRRSPRNPFALSSLAFVVGATVLDVVVARGLDRAGPV